jgi:hypothetical protein
MMTHYVSNEVYYNCKIFTENPGAWYMDSVLSSASATEIAAAKEKVKELARVHTRFKNEKKCF